MPHDITALIAWVKCEARISRDISDCSPLADQFDAIAAALEQGERFREALLIAFELNGSGPWCYPDECPGDDTCECKAKPLHDAVNEAAKPEAQS